MENPETHSELYLARTKTSSQEEQDALANKEHKAFAKEEVSRNPLMAVPIAAAIPIYAAGKATGVIKARSNTSITQVTEAYKGVGEGLVDAAKRFFGTDFSVKGAVQALEEKSASMSFFGMDFGSKKKEMIMPTDKPEQEKSQPTTFENIFTKLLAAESGNRHIDDKGKLITSSIGAEGITQLMPKTAKNPGYGIEPVKDKSEGEYLRVGKAYLQKMHEKFGDWEKALAAYNSGVGNVMKAESKAERFGGDWKDYLPQPKETLPYIEKILGNSQKITEGIAKAAQTGATLLAGTQKPVDIPGMASKAVGDKILDYTGSPALATAGDVATQLAVDPMNLIPGLKGVAALGMLGAFKKSAHEIAIPLTKSEKSFVKEGAFGEQWNEFMKHEGVKWFDRPNFRVFDDELTYHPQDNVVVEKFFKWLADTPSGERKGIPPKFLSGLREEQAAKVGAGETARKGK